MKLFICACLVAFAIAGEINNDVKGLISYNFPSFSIGENSHGEVFINTGHIQEFELVPGINGHENTVSFQSIKKRGHYIRHKSFLAHLDHDDGSVLFKNDASFIVHNSKFYPGYSALESSNFRGHFLRHQGYRIKLHREESNALYKMDASFLVSTVDLFATFESKNYPGYYWGTVGTTARITTSNKVTIQFISPGLTGGADTVSFYVPGGPERSMYLRHRNYVFRSEYPTTVEPDLFRRDATFTIRMDKWFSGYMSFESVNYPGHFIRHRNWVLFIDRSDGSVLFQNDASFKMDIPPRIY